jgi:putative phage-type endonuclease
MSAEQGTAEWLHDKCGNVGASRLNDVMAKIGKGEAATRRNYRAELVCELLTGKSQESYCSPDMQRGIELEPLARAAYEVYQNVMVDQTGFVMHPTVPRSGASPDGLIGEDGLVELKCPKTANHIDYLLGKVPPTQYQPQMLWQMACTGRQWCDFVSYCPDLPEPLQLFVVRFPRDNGRIEEMEKEVTQFNAEVDEIITKLRAIK